MTDVTTKPPAAIPMRALREFGLLMAGMIAGLFGVLFPLLKGTRPPVAPWVIAVLFASFAIIHPQSLALIYRGWMKFGRILGAINSRIILALLFWLVVTPLSLFFKAIGRDILKLKFRNPDAKTYRVPPMSEEPGRGMERPF